METILVDFINHSYITLITMLLHRHVIHIQARSELGNLHGLALKVPLNTDTTIFVRCSTLAKLIKKQKGSNLPRSMGRD